MGIALQNQGKLEEAIDAYNKALSLKPDYAETYNNIGNTLKAQAKLEEAIKAYTKAISIKPNNTESYWNLFGTSENFEVLFGSLKIASERSIPTFSLFMSKAATISISDTL